MGQSREKHPLATEFGARVRQRREELGWSLERLGWETVLHPTYLGSVERGFRNISLINIVRVATALGVDPAALVGGMRMQTEEVWIDAWPRAERGREP